VREARDVGARHRLGRRERRPLALADQQRRVGSDAELARVVGVEVADADELDLSGLTFICASCSTSVMFGAFGFEPGR
jgi:hypothetical protein